MQNKKKNKIKGVIKCKRNKRERVLEEIEKLPKRYNKIKNPKGITVKRENITIEAQ